MATIEFVGVQGASNGTSLRVLDGMTQFSSASFQGADRISGIRTQNGGTGASFQGVLQHMIPLDDGTEIVTSISATAGTGSSTVTIVTVSGFRAKTDYDYSNIFDAPNLSTFNVILDRVLLGNDNFQISGQVSQLWGDLETVTSSRMTHLGNDIFDIAQPTSAATFVSRIQIFGDAQTVQEGAKAAGGDDIVDVNIFSTASFALFGDFETVNGRARYGDDHLDGGGGDDLLYGDALRSGKQGGNDILVSESGADILYGGGGNDKLKAGYGDDWLYGGAGYDILAGGPGADVFVFDAAFRGKADRISDFTPADDTIEIAASLLVRIPTGALSAEAFHKSASGQAHDASDRFIYETDTGKLYYDRDGTGGADRVHLATLGKNLDLTYADFAIT